MLTVQGSGSMVVSWLLLLFRSYIRLSLAGGVGFRFFWTTAGAVGDDCS